MFLYSQKDEPGDIFADNLIPLINLGEHDPCSTFVSNYLRRL